jgi:hypothetical protein
MPVSQQDLPVAVCEGDKPLETQMRAAVERVTVGTRIQILRRRNYEAASRELTATRPRLASVLQGAICARTAIEEESCGRASVR